MDTTADRLAVRERIEAYAAAVVRRDTEGWSGCWADDAVWSVSHGEFRGREAIVEAWVAAMAPYELVGFPVMVGEVVVDGESARALSFVEENLWTTDGAFRRVIGQYNDELVRQDGGWVFKSRRYTVLKRAAG